MKKNLLFVVLVLVCSLCPALNLQAKGNYEFAVTERLLTGSYDGKMLTDTYVCLKTSGGSYTAVKPCTSNSRVYYFNQDGVGEKYTQTAFVEISYHESKGLYYSKKGILQKNKIVGGSKKDYCYVDSTGVVVKDKTTKLAVKFVQAHTKSGWSKSKKLKECYYYLAHHYKYKRYYTNLYPKADSMKDMAYTMFKTHQGNCHCYAATFAYIARVLGYDSRVVVGDISGNRGGMTPHGWTEIKQGGKWYVCDPDMEMNGVSSYMKTATPCRTSVKRRCKLIATNGKVSWK